MRRLTPADYRRMPWRNGGGTTTEITIFPESAALDGGRFVHRVSIADVASDGPFSRFDGYDRHIMLLEGRGMYIDGGPNGRIALTSPLEPYTFSGDWDVVGTLVDGPVRDFNLMVDRSRASATLEVVVVDAPMTVPSAPGETCILHILAGGLAAPAAAEGDTLVADAPFELVPLPGTRIAVARVVARDVASVV